MASTSLSDPVSRWTIQARLHATDEQWNELQRYLIPFEAPAGLVLYDWPAVVKTVGRIARAKGGRSSVLTVPRRPT
jgi:hypothetical protein